MHVIVALLILLLMTANGTERDWLPHPGSCLAAVLHKAFSADDEPQEQVEEYLRAVKAQRKVVADAADIAERFLSTNPHSLDQTVRTRFLAALRELHDTAASATALTPSPELEAIHRQHVDSLSLLASAGDHYTTGMDTHDPSHYDRALTAPTRGRELFEVVGEDLIQLDPELRLNQSFLPVSCRRKDVLITRPHDHAVHAGRPVHSRRVLSWGPAPGVLRSTSMHSPVIPRDRPHWSPRNR